MHCRICLEAFLSPLLSCTRFQLFAIFLLFYRGLHSRDSNFALEGKRSVIDMLNIPIGIVQSKMVRPYTFAIQVFDDLPTDLYVLFLKRDGTAADCVAVDLLESCQSDEQRDVISGVVATAYSGELFMMSATLQTLAHLHNPGGSDTVRSSKLRVLGEISGES